jgi:hypothetical protein
MDGKVGNKPLKTIDIDVAEIKEIICDVETFLYPTREATISILETVQIGPIEKVTLPLKTKKSA